MMIDFIRRSQNRQQILCAAGRLGARDQTAQHRQQKEPVPRLDALPDTARSGARSEPDVTSATHGDGTLVAPAGSLLVADQGSGGHTTADARSMSLRLLRVRIRSDHSGVDLLPALSR